jgi:hypothetical protein
MSDACGANKIIFRAGRRGVGSTTDPNAVSGPEEIR